MKKISRYLSIFCITALIVLAFSQTAFAESSKTNAVMTNDRPSLKFKELCDNFFTNSPEYYVLDTQGEDVSASFYKAYISQYSIGNYELIWKDFKENDFMFKWASEPEKIAEKKSLLTYTASENFYKLISTVQHVPGKTIEALYTISGNYVVNDSTNRITNAYGTTLNVTYSGVGQLFSVSTNGINTNASVSQANNSVTFSGSFYADISAYGYTTGILLWTERTGPHSGSVYRSLTPIG